MPLDDKTSSAFELLLEGLSQLNTEKENKRRKAGSQRPPAMKIYGEKSIDQVKQAARDMSDIAPLVTIAIPAYSPRYFETALLSALNQDYQNLEIVISDDCEDDSIFNIVERHGCDSTVKIGYYHNLSRKGWLDNTDHTARIATSKYLKFLNDDDILLRTCVSKMATILEQLPHIGIVTSRRLPIDEVGKNLPDSLPTFSPFTQNTRISGQDLIRLLRRSEER